MKTMSLEISLLLEFYGALLTDRQRELVDLYYNDDLSLAEISELTGITRQGARDGIKKAEGILLDLEEKLGMYGTYRKNGRATEEILSAADSLAKRYMIPGDDPDLCGMIKNIKTLTGGENAAPTEE